MSDSRPPQERAFRLDMWWAPVAAALVAGIVHIFRVDSIFYFLYGAEAQGMLLASALAKGQGFIDLALPGHPAHVREPPLFYLSLAAIIKTFGFKMPAMKVFMWLGYVATAAAAALFFQRRGRPWQAFLASLWCVLSFELFRFFTGPKSDVPFMALVLFSLFFLDLFMERLHKNEADDTKRGSRYMMPFLAAVSVLLCLAAFFTRSLGLALFMAGAGQLFIYGRKRLSFLQRLKWAAVLIVPLVLALSSWTLHTASMESAGEYNYVDWFLMDLDPDSPEMIAADFHAPLMGEIPRISFEDFLVRSVRHGIMYPAHVYNMLTGGGVSTSETAVFPKVQGAYLYAVYGFLLLIAFLGGYYTERGRSPLVLIFLAAYFAAIVTWPMDDPRLLFPLLPFAAFYTLYGFYELVFLIAGKAAQKPVVARACTIVTAVAFIVLIACHLAANINYYRSVSSLPAYQMRPGFQVRFVSPAHRDSYRLLDRIRKQAKPGAIIMYHSPPPCRLVTGHPCSPIPFSKDDEKVRQYIMENNIDYVVMDEFGRVFPEGPGQFVWRVLDSVNKSYAEDFETVYEIPGSSSKVLRVKREADKD